MNRIVRTVLVVVLAAVALISAGNLARIWYQYDQADRMAQEAARLANAPARTETPPQPARSEPEEGEPEDPYLSVMEQISLDALQEVNPEVTGWILIPDTGISYPVVRHGDNDYYLYRSWKGVSNSSGSIFMDSSNAESMEDFNTILYGHRMNNDSMFGLLHSYEEQDFWQAHPRVYYACAQGVLVYDIFAAYQVDTSGATYTRSFDGEESRQEFLSYCIGRSNIYTGVTPTVQDRILTLSTCMQREHNQNRWVVQAVLRPEGGADAPADPAAPPAGAENPGPGDPLSGRT